MEVYCFPLCNVTIKVANEKMSAFPVDKPSFKSEALPKEHN